MCLLSIVQCRQHLVDKHFERSQLRKTPAVEHEIVHAQVGEGMHLLDQLLRGVDEAEVVSDTAGQLLGSQPARAGSGRLFGNVVNGHSAPF